MSAELLINATSTETRVALIENGILQEVFVERTSRRGLVGNICKGIVSRVLPGMQAAFVDIGRERTAFLHASDIPTPTRAADPGEPDSLPHIESGARSEPAKNRSLEDTMAVALNVATRQTQPPGAGEDTTGRPHENITELLQEGQELMVQVTKDPLGTKGARLTTHISIPSCYLVYMPGTDSVGVSQRIEDERERQRLRDAVRTSLQGEAEEAKIPAGTIGPNAYGNHQLPAGHDPRAVPGVSGTPMSAAGWRVAVKNADHPVSSLGSPDSASREWRGATGSASVAASVHSPTGGYIVRTAAEGASEDKLRADMEFLRKLWASIVERGHTCTAPAVVHEELALPIRAMRELIGTDLERVRIDSRDMYREVTEFAHEFLPEMAPRIEHYGGEQPIFDLYGVEDEIQRALERKVQLKSGGYVIIDQTEAMTTIDVNTGGYVGHRTLEETIFKTNLEAAQAIARQLRLRNLGGIIIIDFIDMNSEEHKRQVLRALERNLERDHTKTQISEVSSLGLVEMTRKRTRESLEHVLCEPCGTCNGRGTVKTPQTVCHEIFREILREARQFDAEKLLVLASQEVIDTLVDEESSSFAELEVLIGKPIKLQVEALYTQEQFDIVLM